MKKIIVAFVIGFTALTANSSKAQVSININIGAQPVWGPVGYDWVDYYYLPDIETYYYVPRHQFIYLSNGRWIFTSSLPARYSRYNLYNGYKVVLNTPRPYLYFNDHKVKYARYKAYKGKQSSIRYSNDPKYFVNPGHPKHSKSKKMSEGKGHDKGRGKGKN